MNGLARVLVVLGVCMMITTGCKWQVGTGETETPAPQAPPEEPLPPPTPAAAPLPVGATDPAAPLPPPTDTSVTAAPATTDPYGRTMVPGLQPAAAPVQPAQPPLPAVGDPAMPATGAPMPAGQPGAPMPGAQPGQPAMPGAPGAPGAPAAPAAPMDLPSVIQMSGASAQGRVVAVQMENKRGVVTYEIEVLGANGTVSRMALGADGRPAPPGTAKVKAPKTEPKIAAAASVAKVTIEQAIGTALKSFPGTVEEAKLSASKGLATWEVEIRGATGQKAKIKVDAGTGNVVPY